MANLFEHEDRRVVPNWRSFGKTTVLGELNSFQTERKISLTKLSIQEYIIDWKFNRTIIYAADLLSAAIINNEKENLNVKEAANYVLSNKEKSSKSQISLANHILDKNNDSDLRIENITTESLTTLLNTELIWSKIKKTKGLLNVYPNNSILYVELSRYYSIVGQENQSIMAMKTALHINNNNRFVLRCATRLFIHYQNNNNNYLDYIHTILKRSSITIFDPWLISAEISVATIRKKPSLFIKKGIDFINSKNILPFNFTELASGIGTVEMFNGNFKKSRDFFRKALINPNDNSLAQIEWASRQDKHLDINPSSFEVKMNFEVLALDSFHNNNFNQSLENATKWLIDMPFSKRPILFGSNLASTILKDQLKSISLVKVGLISHPNDPQLINNLAYALALDGKPKEAFIELGKIKNHSNLDSITEICLSATKGLSFFRSNLLEEGRQFYFDAIEKTKQIQNKELNYIAILNYAREEILVKSEFVDSIMDAVNRIPNDSKEVLIRILKKEVVELYKNSI